MLTISDLLTRIIQLAFVGLGILSLTDYLRYSGQVRRDIALMFGSLAVAIGLGMVSDLLRISSAFLSLIATCAILAQPYLLLRLVAYFHQSSWIIGAGAIVGMVLSWIIVVIGVPTLPTILTVIVVLYFVVFDAYAMVAFVQGALRTSGVVQRRLRYAAAGSGLLALALLCAGVGAALRPLLPIMTVLVQLEAIAAALTFYLGLASPHWLRQTWQLLELRQFLLHLNGDAPPDSVARLYATLCQGMLKVTGASRAAILLKPQDKRGWTLNEGANSSSITPTIGIGEIESYWQRQSTGVLPIQSLNPELRALLRPGSAEFLYLVPLVRDQRGWGVILVFVDHGSLFVEDDLEIITLLAEQSAVALENIELVESLRQYAISLEEQTVHLTAANKELEAFSYSVSHDLRTPLRAIDGFSLALLEDYEAILDDTGRDYLRRIRTESQRMGQLIDDLIGLSRFSRAEMLLKPVDLSAIVREIAVELEAKEPNRVVEFVIQNDVQACADERLMRVALENLIGNAWKYTSKRPVARIEFGWKNENGLIEYFVRDNGVGFNMAYVDKLFGAFQRLHAMDEFVGTGIGLAIVQRIMHRHGGKARAEAVVNEGATFYFTIGTQNCA
ncbi:MAG TPA: ATP-binding protein [Phototrophicaceae bacterium]|nr:ATP-binding protein [Phototrophicaceae bacterium]